MRGRTRAADWQPAFLASALVRSEDLRAALLQRIRDEAQEAEDYRARQENIKKWEAFCKPTRTYDNFGMVRLVYARNGCEFGRNE